MTTLMKCWYCDRRFEVDEADRRDGVAEQHHSLLGHVAYVHHPPCLGGGLPFRYLDGPPGVPTVDGLPA